jgi:hypothetical protein
MVLANTASRAGAKGRIEAGVELAEGEVITTLTSIEVGGTHRLTITADALSAEGLVPHIHVQQPSLSTFALPVFWPAHYHTEAIRNLYPQNLYRKLIFAVSLLVCQCHR